MTGCMSGKIPFDSRAAANAQLRRLKKRGKGRGCEAYECVRCGAFHLGRPQRWQRQRGRGRSVQPVNDMPGERFPGK